MQDLAMELKILATAAAATISVLLSMVGHYLPWTAIFQRKPYRWFRHVVTAASAVVPFLFLLVISHHWAFAEYVLAYSLCVAGAGFGSAFARHIDQYITTKTEAREAAEREKALLEKLLRGDHAPHD